MVGQWFDIKTTRTVCQRFGLKTTRTSKPLGRFLSIWPQNRWRWFLLVWPQNRWLRIFWFGPQNQQLWFGDLGLKITVMVSWIGAKNKVGYGLSVAPQNWQEDKDEVRHTPRSCGLLWLEAIRDTVSQSGLKTDGGATADDARGIIMEVAWSWSWRWSVRWRRVQYSASRMEIPFVRCI
jgi:hypothetical protein